MTPARKQTRFIGYPSENLVPILTELPRLIGQFLMSSITASFGIIYNYFGNSITIRSIDKVSLSKTRGTETRDKQAATEGKGKLEVVQQSGAVYKV